MDTDICRWISEFVMRNTAAQDHVIKKLLRALPVSGADSRFKKTALLRTIQAEISDASLTETTLDNLEVMEELDRDDGAEISKALTAAYRAVAVECTVKYLAGSGDRHGKYFEAVKRVWRGRIGGLERSGRSELVTGELRRWGDDVEAAVWDAKVARRLLKVNTRNEALEAVRVYLGEAWALMGPTFLQSAAAVAEPDGVQRSGASAGDLAVKNAVNRVEEVAGKMTKVNQVEEVAMHTPCVGELAGKTVNQVEEVGAKKTPNAGQDVGELANRLVANSRNVVELEAKRVNQVEELAVNMPNVVESDADMVNRVEKVGANMPNVVELAAKTANWVAANMPNVVELEMETVNLVEQLVGNTSNVSQDVGELSGETANQVALNTPCVGELAGKTMNQVEEVGAKNTPNAGQDVGELTAKMANQVVANSRNVVELEVERLSRVKELAANMTNVVESDMEMVNCFEKVAANMPNVVELASKRGNRVAATTQNVIELEMETVNLVEELVGNTSNVSRDVGELSLETANQVGSNTPNVGQDVGVGSRPELREGEGRGLVALQSGTWDLIVRDRAAAGRVDEIQKGVELPRRKHAVCHKRSKGGVKITDTEEMDIDVSCSKYDSLLSPEVNKVQEALRSSSLELKAVVKDPLPDALRLAESVISNMVSKDKQHEPSVENQGGKDINAPNPSVNTGDEPAQTNDSNRGNQSCSHQSNARRPGLMERNSTAHAYEWDDSIDDSPEGMTNDASRLHLPSPKRKLVSPLKKHEVTKFARRRQMKRWSLLEEDTLRTAVQKYGKGNWKLILNCYRDFFEERTEVDLKDKWRNMSRY